MSAKKNRKERGHIKIGKKEKCCGCNACMNACEQNCISMETDSEGFLYPHVNTELCIECGNCTSKCHMIMNVQSGNQPVPDCWAAYNRDDKKMQEGSSGGIFESLCEVVYDMQGIVYGAVLDGELHVKHQRALNMEDAKKFRKSKYLQSDIGYTFSMAKEDLERGKTVLFSGTPCQIGGLYGYLGKDYENLYTVDLVCHGVPSQKVFSQYLEELERAYGTRPVFVCWRDKRDGWGPNKVSVRFENGYEIVSPSSYNTMQFGFLNNLYSRPSCSECRYASVPRIADISLGDFWGYDGELLTGNQNKGISMIAVSNRKGMFLFEKIRPSLIAEKVSVEYCKSKSAHFGNTPGCHKNRKKFMDELDTGKDLNTLIGKYLYGENCTKEFELCGLKEFIENTGNNYTDHQCRIPRVFPKFL